MGQDDPLARRQAAQALVPRRRGQPGADPIRILDAVDVLEQAEPGGLGDIGSVAVEQLELGGNGPDEPGVLVNQALPGPPVPAAAPRTSPAMSTASPACSLVLVILLSPIVRRPDRRHPLRVDARAPVMRGYEISEHTFWQAWRTMPMTTPLAYDLLIGSPTSDHVLKSFSKDLQVQYKRPVLDVPQVEPDRFLPGQIGSSVHLPEAGQARLDYPPATAVLGVPGGLARQCRPWPDQ